MLSFVPFKYSRTLMIRIQLGRMKCLRPTHFLKAEWPLCDQKVGTKRRNCVSYLVFNIFTLSFANISWVLRDIVNKLIWKFSNLYNVNYSYHHGCLQHILSVKASFHLCYTNRGAYSLALLYSLILFIVKSQVTGVTITPSAVQRIIW